MDSSGETLSPTHLKRTKRDAEEFISPALKVLRDHNDLKFVLAEYLYPRSRINARTALRDKEGWIPKQVLEYVEEKRGKGESLKWGYSSLRRVVKEDKFELVKWAGTLSEYVKVELFDCAAEFAKLHMLKWAREQQPPLPWDDALERAFEWGHYDTLEWLIETGFPWYDEQKTDFLGYECVLEDEEEWKNIEVNQAIYGGYTTLMMACKFGHTELVRHLLARNGINVNMENSQRMTGLLFACRNGKLEVVKLLLEHKDININQADEDGRNALHFAIEEGHNEVVKAISSHLQSQI
eukprot:g5632.t1